MRKRLLAFVLCAAVVSSMTVTLVVSAREASNSGTVGIDVAGFLTSLHGSITTAQHPSISGADLAVSMDYKRDLNDGFGYKTKDDKTVYGGDTVIYTIAATNHGPKDATNVNVNDLLPSGLKFISATPSKGTYDSQSGDWKVGNLNAGEQATLQLKAKVIQSGEIKNKAIVTDDSNSPNNVAVAKFTAHNPVILVHGFDNEAGIQYLLLWHKLMHKLDTEGIRYYAFDYHSASNEDPHATASALFEPWMNQKKTELGYGDAPYNGKFDIICHSMGALVTRFYIEDNPANAQNIGRWIGIGPTNRGAAIADIYYHRELSQQLHLDSAEATKFFNELGAVVPMNSSAVFSMQTTNPEIMALNEHFTPTGINYKIIEGTNATLFTVEAVEKTATGQYQFTLAGDGVVANAQSELPGVPIYKVNGANHLTLVDDSRVIAKVIEYLET
ncbi:MAG: hypothetical protein WAL97_05230 [Halobacteriota archaeon]